MSTMRALVKRKPEAGIWMENVPQPKAGMNEVLIKVEKTAICGTDLHIYKWDEWSQRTIKPGLVIGHEFVGRIVELGLGVDNYQIGDRVVVVVEIDAPSAGYVRIVESFDEGWTATLDGAPLDTRRQRRVTANATLHVADVGVHGNEIDESLIIIFGP